MTTSAHKIYMHCTCRSLHILLLPLTKFMYIWIINKILIRIVFKLIAAISYKVLSK